MTARTYQLESDRVDTVATADPGGADQHGFAAVVAGWWLLPVCLVVAFVAYLPSALRAGFVNFDDPFYFGPDNPLFRAADAAARQHGVFAGLATVLDPRQLVADVYLPVAHGSLWLDHWLFAGDPLGPHLVAVLLHGLAAFALLGVLRRLVDVRLAAGATLLFLVHPALCESVAWVSSRKDLLAGLFVFLALQGTARAAARPTAWTLVATAACGVLAMYSKGTAVVQPLLAVLVCAALPGSRRRWLAPLVLAIVTAPIALHHQANALAQGTMQGGDAAARLGQVPGALLHYLATALWPSGLNVLYPERKTLAALAAVLPIAAAVLALLVGVGIACWRRPARRPVALGVAGFLAALATFNTAWPASVIAVADRYLYLALPFLALAVLAVLGRWLRRPLTAAVALSLPLLVGTWFRAPVFASSEALWQASLAVDGENAVALLNLLSASAGSFDLGSARSLAERAAAVARYPEHERRARLLLAQYALQENRGEEAALQTERAIAATERIAASGRVDAAVARALLVRTLLSAITPYRLLGRSDEARAALARAEQLAPDDGQVRATAVLLMVEALATRAGTEVGVRLRDDAADVQAIAAHLAAARAVEPVEPLVEYAAGMFARLRGRRLEAIGCFRRALDREPGLVDAWLAAAEVFLDAGQCSDAEDYARRGFLAARAAGRPVDARLRLCLAKALKGQGRLDQAIDSLRVYVREQPRDRNAARLYSGLLMHKARVRLNEPDVTHQELQALVDDALRVHPQEPAVDLVRARMLRDQRRFSEAAEALQRLQAALPELEDVGTMLADNLRDLGYERRFVGDDEGAVAAWLRLRAVAPEGFDLDAVQLQLAAIWRRFEAQGITARSAGDRKAAAAAFRSCLRIDPEQHWAAWLLASTLFDEPDADLAELEQLSDLALAWCRRHRIDRSRQVALRATVLGRLQRRDEARRLVDDYLAAVDAEAAADVLGYLRGLQAEFSR